MKILCKARGGQKITSQSFQKSSQEHPNSIHYTLKQLHHEDCFSKLLSTTYYGNTGCGVFKWGLQN